ncbi:MAG: restriction endonuclease [Sphingobacteriales bacterium]|nr:restriction endonuclease [Sphingobacteriales bacterium]
MMIPDYQQTMLPLLKFLSDGKPHTTAESVPVIAKHFNLTEEEQNQLLPNLKRTVINNRIHWARAHLKMAGLIENTAKWTIQITERGRQVLDENPSSINIRYLMDKFSDYNEKIKSFRYKKKEESLNEEFPSEITENTIQTPEELLESGYIKIRETLEQELLSKLKSVHPSFFERIVVELLVKMGYGGSIQDAGKAIGKSGDEGIDGIIKEDKLGLDVIYVQAKRWEGTVGRPELQKFVGALAGQGAKKGIFITTSSFTKDAIDYAPKNETKIVLVDGEKLAQYMIDYNLGVSVQSTYEIKKIDLDSFDEE